MCSRTVEDVLMLPLQEPLNPPSKTEKGFSGARGEKSNGDVPLFFQAIRRNANGLAELLEMLQANPELVELRHNQDTPLHAACHAQNLPALTELLLFGAQVEGLDGQGDTALHVAVREGWHDGVAKLLLGGASPNTKCQPPPKFKQFPVETPFHAAVRRGDNFSTALILQYRPDFCLKDNEHCSVLHLAVKTHNISLLRRLLRERGCSDIITSVDVRGNTVLHTALSRKCSEDEQHILEIIKDLVDLGLGLNSSNQLGETPLFLALRLRLTGVVQWLLTKGADPLCVNFQEQTVLHIACEAGSGPSLRYLLNSYYLSHLLLAADSAGHEPFHMAVFSGSLECCEILLNHGDHLTFRDKHGRTRLSYVLKYLPKATRLLNKIFDSRIRFVNEPVDNPDFHVSFDYSVLMSTDERKSSIVPELAKSNLRELLQHPLVESFLFFKLWVITFIKYCNCIFLFLFMILHTSFLIIISRQSFIFEYYPILLTKYYVLHVLLFVITATPPKLKILISSRKYSLNLETIFEIGTLTGILCAFLSHYTVIENNLQTVEKGENGIMPEKMQFNQYLGAATVFLGWVLLLIQIGKMRPFGLYYFLFNNVLKEAVMVFLSVLSLFVAIVGGSYFLLPAVSLHSFSENVLEFTLQVFFLSSFIIIMAFLVGVMATTTIRLVGLNFSEVYRRGELGLLLERASELEDFQNLLQHLRSCHCSKIFVCRFLKKICTVSESVTIYPKAKTNPCIVRRFLASAAYGKIVKFSNSLTNGVNFPTIKSGNQDERWTRQYDSESSNPDVRIVSLQTQFDLVATNLQCLSQYTEDKQKFLQQQLSQLRTTIRESREEKAMEQERLSIGITEHSLMKEPKGPYQLSSEAQTSFMDNSRSTINVSRAKDEFMSSLPLANGELKGMSFYC